MEEESLQLQGILSEVIERAATQSHSPEGEWLPFHMISQCLEDICLERHLGSKIEKRLFQVLLLMSSETESSLTWWEKLANFDRYNDLAAGNQNNRLFGDSSTGHVDSPGLLSRAVSGTGARLQDTFTRALSSESFRGRSSDRSPAAGSMHRSHSVAFHSSSGRITDSSPTRPRAGSSTSSRRSISQPHLVMSTKLPSNPTQERTGRYSKEVSMMSPTTLEEGARLSAVLNGRGFGAAQKGHSSASRWNDRLSSSSSPRGERFDQTAANSAGGSRATLFSMQRSQAYDASVRYLSLSGGSDISAAMKAGHGFDETISANIPRGEPMLTPNEQRNVREAEAEQQYRNPNRRDGFMPQGGADIIEEADGALSDEEKRGGSKLGQAQAIKRASSAGDDDNLSVQSKSSRAGSVTASTKSVGGLKSVSGGVASKSSIKKGGGGGVSASHDGNDSDSTIESKSSKTSSNLGPNRSRGVSLASNATAKGKVSASTAAAKSSASTIGTTTDVVAAAGGKKSPVPPLPPSSSSASAASAYQNTSSRGQPSPRVTHQGNQPPANSSSNQPPQPPLTARSAAGYSVGFSTAPVSMKSPTVFSSSRGDDTMSAMSSSRMSGAAGAGGGGSSSYTSRSSSRYNLTGSPRVSLDDPVVRDLFIDSQLGWRPENPADASAALHVFILVQNWLTHKRFRKTVEDVLWGGSSSRKGKRRWPEVVGADPEMRCRSVAIMLHSHFTNLSDVVHSLYGCEQWLRGKLRVLITSEALAETFYAWGAYTGVLSVARHHWDTLIRRKLIDRFAGNLIRHKLNRKRVKRMLGHIEVSVSAPALLSPAVIWAYWLPKMSRGKPLPEPQLRPAKIQFDCLRKRFGIHPLPVVAIKGKGAAGAGAQEVPTTYEEDCVMMDEYMDRISLLFAFRRLRHRLVYLKKSKICQERAPFHKKKIVVGKWKLTFLKYKMIDNARHSKAIKLYRALVAPHLLRRAVYQLKQFKRYIKIEAIWNENFRSRYASNPVASRALSTLMSPWKVRCFYAWLKNCHAGGLSPQDRMVANAHRAKTCSRSYLRRWRLWCLQVAAQRVPQGGSLLPGGGFGLEHLVVQPREKWRGENLEVDTTNTVDEQGVVGVDEQGLPQCPSITPISTADGERFNSFDDLAPHALSQDLMSPLGVIEGGGRNRSSAFFSKAPTPYRPARAQGTGKVFQQQQRLSGTFSASFASSTIQFSSFTQKPITQSRVLVLDGRRQLVTGTAAAARFSLRMANLSRALWRWRAFARSGASRVYFSAGDFYRSEDIADTPTANLGKRPRGDTAVNGGGGRGGDESSSYNTNNEVAGGREGDGEEESDGREDIGSRNCDYSVRQRKSMLFSRFVTSCKFIRNRTLLGRSSSSSSSMKGGRSVQGRFLPVPEEGYIAQSEGVYAELVVRPDDPASEKIRIVRLVQLNFWTNKVFLKTFNLTNPLGYVGRAQLSTGTGKGGAPGEALLQRGKVPVVVIGPDGILRATAPLLVRYTRRWLLHVNDMRIMKRKAAAVWEIKKKSILKEFLFFWKIEYRSATHKNDAKLNTFIFALKRGRRMHEKAMQTAVMIEDHILKRNFQILVRAYRRFTVSRHEHLTHFLSAAHHFPYAEGIIWKATRLIKNDGMREIVGFSRHSGATMAELAADRLALPAAAAKGSKSRSRTKVADERFDVVEIFQKYSIALFVSDSIGKFLRARRLLRRWWKRTAFRRRIRRLLQPKVSTDKLRVVQWLRRMTILRGKLTAVSNKRAAKYFKLWRLLKAHRVLLRGNLRHAFLGWKGTYRLQLLQRAFTPPYRIKCCAAFLRWKNDHDRVQGIYKQQHLICNNILRRTAWDAMILAIDSIRAEKFLMLRKAVRRLVAVRYSRQASRAQMLLVYFHRLQNESDRRFRARKAMYLLWKTVLLTRGMRGLMGGIKKKMKERKRRRLLSMSSRMKSLVKHLAQLSARFAPNDVRFSPSPSFAESLRYLLAPTRSASVYSEYRSTVSPRGIYAKFSRAASVVGNVLLPPSKRESEVFPLLPEDAQQMVAGLRSASKIRTSIASVRRAVPSTLLEMVFEPDYGGFNPDHNNTPAPHSRLSATRSMTADGLSDAVLQKNNKNSPVGGGRGGRSLRAFAAVAGATVADYGFPPPPEDLRDQQEEEEEEKEEQYERGSKAGLQRQSRSRSSRGNARQAAKRGINYDTGASSSDIVISSDDSDSESDLENFEHDIFGDDEEQRAQAQVLASRASSRHPSRSNSQASSRRNNSRRTTLTNFTTDPSVQENLATMHLLSSNPAAAAGIRPIGAVQDALSHHSSTKDEAEEETKTEGTAAGDELSGRTLRGSLPASSRPLSIVTDYVSPVASRHASISSAAAAADSTPLQSSDSHQQHQPLSSLTQGSQSASRFLFHDVEAQASATHGGSRRTSGTPSDKERASSSSPSSPGHHDRSLLVSSTSPLSRRSSREIAQQGHDASPVRRLSIVEEAMLLSQSSSRRSSFSSTASESRRRSSTASVGGIPPLSPHSFATHSREHSPRNSGQFLSESLAATGGGSGSSRRRRSSVTESSTGRSPRTPPVAGVDNSRRASVSRESGNNASYDGEFEHNNNSSSSSSNIHTEESQRRFSAIEALERGSAFQPIAEETGTMTRSISSWDMMSRSRRASMCSAEGGRGEGGESRRGSESSYHGYHSFYNDSGGDSFGSPPAAAAIDSAVEEEKKNFEGNSSSSTSGSANRLHGLNVYDSSRRCSTASVDMNERRRHDDGRQESPYSRVSSPINEPVAGTVAVSAQEVAGDHNTATQAATSETEGGLLGRINSHTDGGGVGAAVSRVSLHTGDDDHDQTVYRDKKKELSARFEDEEEEREDKEDFADERKDGQDDDDNLRIRSQTPLSEASTAFTESVDNEDEDGDDDKERRRGGGRNRGREGSRREKSGHRVSRTFAENRGRRDNHHNDNGDRYDDDDDYDSDERDVARGGRINSNIVDRDGDINDDDDEYDVRFVNDRNTDSRNHNHNHDQDKDLSASSEGVNRRDTTSNSSNSPSRWTPGRRAYEERRRRAAEEKAWENYRQLHPHDQSDDYARFRFLSAYEGSHINPVKKGENRVGGGYDSGIGGVGSPSLQGFPAGYQTRREFGEVLDDTGTAMSHAPDGYYSAERRGFFYGGGGDTTASTNTTTPFETSSSAMRFDASAGGATADSGGGGVPRAGLHDQSRATMSSPFPSGTNAADGSSLYNNYSRDYQEEYLQWLTNPTRRHYSTHPWYLRDFLQMRHRRYQRELQQKKHAVSTTNPLVVAKLKPRQLVIDHPNVRSHKIKSEILKTTEVVSRIARKQSCFRLWRDLSSVAVELRWLADAHWRSSALRRYFVHLWSHRQKCRENLRQKLALCMKKFRVAIASRAVGKRLNITADGYHAHALARRYIARWQKHLARRGVAKHRTVFADDFCIARRAALGFISLKVNTVRMPRTGSARDRDQGQDQVRSAKQRRRMSMGEFAADKPKVPRPAPRASISLRHRDLLTSSNQPSPVTSQHRLFSGGNTGGGGIGGRKPFWSSSPNNPEPADTVQREECPPPLAQGLSQMRVVGASSQQHSQILRSAMKSAAKAVQSSLKKSLKDAHPHSHTNMGNNSNQRRSSLSSSRVSAPNSRRTSVTGAGSEMK